MSIMVRPLLKHACDWWPDSKESWIGITWCSNYPISQLRSLLFTVQQLYRCCTFITTSNVWKQVNNVGSLPSMVIQNTFWNFEFDSIQLGHLQPNSDFASELVCWILFSTTGWQIGWETGTVTRSVEDNCSRGHGRFLCCSWDAGSTGFARQANGCWRQFHACNYNSVADSSVCKTLNNQRFSH